MKKKIPDVDFPFLDDLSDGGVSLVMFLLLFLLPSPFAFSSAALLISTFVHIFL